MPYKKQSRRKRYRRKTAKGNWRWTYYRGLHKKTPESKAKKTPKIKAKKTPKIKAKKTPKRLRRRTVRRYSPVTPPGYYNQYLNPNIYK